MLKAQGLDFGLEDQGNSNKQEPLGKHPPKADTGIIRKLTFLQEKYNKLQLEFWIQMFFSVPFGKSLLDHLHCSV